MPEPLSQCYHFRLQRDPQNAIHNSSGPEWLKPPVIDLWCSWLPNTKPCNTTRLMDDDQEKSKSYTAQPEMKKELR